LENHITNIVTRYKGRCYSWDVVNEALEDNGRLRDSVFLRVIGPAYIPIAFRAAGRADPGARLYYNEYNVENDYDVRRVGDREEHDGGLQRMGQSQTSSVAESGEKNKTFGRLKIDGTKEIVRMTRVSNNTLSPEPPSLLRPSLTHWPQIGIRCPYPRHRLPIPLRIQQYTLGVNTNPHPNRVHLS
jgi:hypothetical protein